MAKIKHRVGIVSSLQDVWLAVTVPERICGWWASSADGTTELGSMLNLNFEGLTTLSFTIIERRENQLLHLKNIGGPGAWSDSELEFHLERSEKQTFFILRHYSDSASEDDFQFFITKWPIFMVSLKSYVEMGKGHPYPNDIKIEVDL